MVKVCLTCQKRSELDDDGEGDGVESHGLCPSKEGYPCKEIYLRWMLERSKLSLHDFYKEVTRCGTSTATSVSLLVCFFL